MKDVLKELERRVRYHCREIFHSSRLLTRIIPAIDTALGAGGEIGDLEKIEFDLDGAAPGGLWDPAGDVAGGVNRAGDTSEEGGDDDRDHA